MNKEPHKNKLLWEILRDASHSVSLREIDQLQAEAKAAVDEMLRLWKGWYLNKDSQGSFCDFLRKELLGEEK